MVPEVPMTEVHFLLGPDEDGWPPVEGETLWAFTLGDYQYRLDNIPWYVRGIALYDVVEAVAFNPDEVPIFTRVIEHSGHLTLRLIPSGERTAPTLLAVLAEFNELGTAGEIDPHRGLIALTIPPTVALSPLKEHLLKGFAEGRWDYEEGFVDDRWLAVQMAPKLARQGSPPGLLKVGAVLRRPGRGREPALPVAPRAGTTLYGPRGTGTRPGPSGDELLVRALTRTPAPVRMGRRLAPADEGHHRVKESLRPGLEHHLTFQVPVSKTVPALFPESAEFQAMPEVFATGFLVGLLEWACIQLVNPHLDWPAEQTVGTHIDVSHAAATPPGLHVTVTARLTELDRRRLTFDVEARDEVDLISRGTHHRAVIDAERFTASVQAKAASRP